jgi:hypothetical protein
MAFSWGSEGLKTSSGFCLEVDDHVAEHCVMVLVGEAVSNVVVGMNLMGCMSACVLILASIAALGRSFHAPSAL